MQRQTTRDYFDKARLWCALAMVLAGAAAIAGSGLDWIRIVEAPELRTDTTFEPDELGATEPTEPFSGIEAGDGWWTAAGGAVLALAGIALLSTGRAGFGWLGVVAALVIGVIALADYRGIGELSSSFSRRTDITGDAEPALGITLVAGAALAGFVASMGGLAATPRRQP